jgi:NAD-dependent deacetylase
MSAPRPLPREAEALLEGAAEGLVLFLTGAGISAESGIPTFRGPEGYWTVGSRSYHPTELATRAAFERVPREVWAWYLYRRAVCRAAAPNAAHRALAELEAALGDRLLLLTQNVDGLHLRAGSSRARTYEIHGNIDFMRFVDESQARPLPLPEGIDVEWSKGRALTDAEWALLRGPSGARARPHVLWFDESYDEPNFRFESSLSAAARASLLVVVGTTGATNLPLQVGRIAAGRGVPLVVVNPEPNPFSEHAARGPGIFLAGTATEWVPSICAALASGR